MVVDATAKEYLVGLLLLAYLFGSSARAAEFESTGSATLRIEGVKDDVSGDNGFYGLRYVHELAASTDVQSGSLMANYAAIFDAEHHSNAPDTSSVRNYRAWLRFTSDDFQARLGLQQINFGQGYILRPLRWFDTIDRTDLELRSEGVNGLLLKKYFGEESSLWVWALAGDDAVRGNEIVPGIKNRIESGGRFQTAGLGGELAVSWHTRKTNQDWWRQVLTPVALDGREYRVGFDGVWDLGFGFWTEGFYSHTKVDQTNNVRQAQVAVALENSYGDLVLRAEQLQAEVRSTLVGWSSSKSFTAINATYSIDAEHSIRGTYVYDWSESKANSSIGFVAAYDRWQFLIEGFSRFIPEQTGTKRENGLKLNVFYRY